jgi:hypothetical protein
MSILSSTARAAASRLFPELELSASVNFAPMERIDRGEFSSSVALELARLTKQRAEDIAERLIAEIQAEVPVTLRCDSGYVVALDLPRDLVLSEVSPDVKAALKGAALARQSEDFRMVRCLLPDCTEPVYARLRLVARVIQQAFLTVMFEDGCDVFIDPLPARRLHSQSDVVDFFRSVVSYVIEHEGERRLEVSGEHARAASSRTCVWTTHHYHERLPRDLRVALSVAKKGGVIDLRMPIDAWLLSRDRVLSGLLDRGSLEGVVAALTSDEAWLRFLFHAGSTVLSGDYDPAVALFDEFASPLYSLRLLVDRYRRFSGYFPLPVAVQTVAEILRSMRLDRRLGLRALSMPVYTARAIALGEMAEWSVALEDFTSRAHAFINSPKIRASLEQGQVSGEVGEIVASLGLGLSSILRFVAEGPCVDQ